MLNSYGKIQKLQTVVENNKYNKAGTDAVTLDSEDHQQIYLIDHSSQEEYLNHRAAGRHGLGIRKVYEFNKLTEALKSSKNNHHKQ